MNESYFSSNTRLKIRLFDTYSLISNILTNYLSYGFENLDYCWDIDSSSSTVVVRCTNLSRHVFTDQSHFTSAMQMFIAKEFFTYLSASQNGSVSSSFRTQFSFNRVVFFSVVLLTINYP